MPIVQGHFKDAAFALVEVQYETWNRVQVCREGDHPFDLQVEGVTPIGKAILGQLSWDCLEVRRTCTSSCLLIKLLFKNT
jgi:hypothetical protein